MPLTPGSELCDSCDGEGTIEPTLPVSLNRGLMFVDFRFLQKIHTLPNVQAFINKSNAELVHFTFEEGEGVVMPLRNDSKAAETTKQQWGEEKAIA